MTILSQHMDESGPDEYKRADANPNLKLETMWSWSKEN